MSTATRQGPRLTVVGTCDGCEHCRVHRGALRCMADPKRTRLTGTRPPRTPTWCPHLPEARAALGRELMATAEGAPAHGSGIPARGETARCGPGPGVSPYKTDMDRALCALRMRAAARRDVTENSKPHGAGEESER